MRDSEWPRLGEAVWSTQTGVEYRVVRETVDTGEGMPLVGLSRAKDGGRLNLPRNVLTRTPQREREWMA